MRALVATRLAQDGGPLAIAMDARSASSFADLPADVHALKAEGHDVKVLFLSAKTESLIARFSETRRSHPLSHRLRPDQSPNDRPTLVECIRQEREMLVTIEGLGHVIDTSGLSANKLRSWIKDLVNTERTPLTLLFESFAFKFGVPLDADIVVDVRDIPNPFYYLALRPLTGRDQPVIDFLATQPEATDLFIDIRDFVAKWLPSFEKENRSYLTVAIGCTGGQHRSVYIAERLTEFFKSSERVILRHRELALT